MDVWNYATDVRIFILMGIVLALCIGSLGEIVSTLSIVVLIFQMTASIQGLHLDREEMRRDLCPSLISLFCCFGLCTATALLCGLFFRGDQALWYGWVMLASVPAGVSVVTLSLMMKGNMAMTLLSMVIIYGCALAITPLMTYVLIGDAVSPLEILKYIILFIGIPVFLNIPLSRVTIQRKYKVTFINFMMMLLIIFALGTNRDFIFSNLDIIGCIVLLCAIRTFGVATFMLMVMKRKGCNRENTLVHVGYSVWKNSGLGASLCMILLVAYPLAALPCALSLVTESVWFAITNKEVATRWPSKLYPEETVMHVPTAEKH